jgi:lipopolysaccharide export system permease protein
MARLTSYLVRIFTIDTVSLLVIVTSLIWLLQCLKIFDVVSVRGQGLFTLLGQALLSMPALVVAFLYVSMGIGLARALRSLQNNRELHIIHSSRQLPSLLRATAIFSTIGAVFVLLVSHLVEPVANRQLSSWSASIAADLVGRTLTPHRFTQMMPGVVVMIGGRQGNGEITDFFADDRRDPEVRRTYIAQSATVSADEKGYVLQLYNGSLQYTPDGTRFSQIAFSDYKLPIDKLTAPPPDPGNLSERDSLTLVGDALNTGVWSEAVRDTLIERMGEGLRVFSVCIAVLAVAGFPHVRRARNRFPLEASVLLLAFIERAISTYAPVDGTWRPLTGAALMFIVGAIGLGIRLRGGLVSRFGAQPA